MNIKRGLFFVCALVLVPIYLAGCGGSSAINDNNVPAMTTALISTLPTAFKTGGSVSTSSIHINTAGPCPNGTPVGTATCSPPPSLGNILWLAWDMEYGPNQSPKTTGCDASTLASGDCFQVHPSTGITDWNSYDRPASIANQDLCRESGSSISGTSVVATACSFEQQLMVNHTTVDTCYNSTGSDVNISLWIPWAAGWTLPATMKFQGSFIETDSAMWFGVNPSITSSQWKYGVSLSTGTTMGNYLHYLSLNTNTLFDLVVSGPSSGTGTQGIKAYVGNLPTSGSTQGVGAFEAIQILEYTPGNSFTIRMKSNGTYVWIQEWQNEIPGDAGFDAGAPTSFECFKYGANFPDSTYEAESGCLSSFGLTRAELNTDSLYILALQPIVTSRSSWYGKMSTLYNPTSNPLLPTTAAGKCYP